MKRGLLIFALCLLGLGASITPSIPVKPVPLNAKQSYQLMVFRAQTLPKLWVVVSTNGNCITESNLVTDATTNFCSVPVSSAVVGLTPSSGWLSNTPGLWPATWKLTAVLTNQPSVMVSVTGQPVEFFVAKIASTSKMVSWTAVPAAASYNIYWSTNTVPWTGIYGITATNFLLVGLPPATTCRIWVTAQDSAGHESTFPSAPVVCRTIPMLTITKG